MTTPNASQLSLAEAAQQMVSAFISEHDAEILLARAIEHGELQASVKRWASEQWAGRRLPGNIDPRETCIECAELAAWRQRQA